MFPDTKMSDEDAMHIELVASEAIRLNDLHGDQGSEDAIEASNNFFEEFRKAGFDTSKYETEKSSQNDMIIDALKRMREWRA
jgi:hypothetical protein